MKLKLFFGLFFISAVEAMPRCATTNSFECLRGASVTVKPPANKERKQSRDVPPMVRFAVESNKDDCLCSGAMLLPNVAVTTMQCGGKLKRNVGTVGAIIATADKFHKVNLVKQVEMAQNLVFVRLDGNFETHFQLQTQSSSDARSAWEGQWHKQEGTHKWTASAFNSMVKKEKGPHDECNSGAPIYIRSNNNNDGQFLLHGVAGDLRFYVKIYKDKAMEKFQQQVDEFSRSPPEAEEQSHGHSKDNHLGTGTTRHAAGPSHAPTEKIPLHHERIHGPAGTIVPVLESGIQSESESDTD